MNHEFAIKIYQQLMEHWIVPVINKRQKNGDLPSHVNIEMAQIIFCPDAEEPLVHINDEVKIIAKVELNCQEQKSLGSEVGVDEIDKFIALKINEKKYPNCGHATFIIHGGGMLLDFDLTKYRSLSKKNLDTANEFLASSIHALSNDHLRSFIDTLFSASELIAKSILLITADNEFAKKTNHRAIHCKYNQYSKYGNVDNDFVKTHNALSKLRNSARYLNNNLSITEDEAKEYLKTIKFAYKYAIDLAMLKF